MRLSISLDLPAPPIIVVVVFIDDHFLGATEILQSQLLKLQAEVFGDGLAARERGDVFEHSLARSPTQELSQPRT